ncbi:MAG: hypothetical protein H7Y17_06350 [Chlorobia bacterium]|nr:hypothetical protein [Fimbriimonadaceae bacterium]
MVPAGWAGTDFVYSDVAIINALQENNASKINGHIRFEKLSLSAYGQTMSLVIPIATVNEPRLGQLVQDEQMSRLKVLANWVFNTQNAPAPAPPAR